MKQAVRYPLCRNALLPMQTHRPEQKGCKLPARRQTSACDILLKELYAHQAPILARLHNEHAETPPGEILSELGGPAEGHHPRQQMVGSATDSANRILPSTSTNAGKKSPAPAINA